MNKYFKLSEKLPNLENPFDEVIYKIGNEEKGKRCAINKLFDIASCIGFQNVYWKFVKEV